MSADDLDADDISGWRELIVATGAVDWIEKLIDSRLTHALSLVDAARRATGRPNRLGGHGSGLH